MIHENQEWLTRHFDVASREIQISDVDGMRAGNVLSENQIWRENRGDVISQEIFPASALGIFQGFEEEEVDVWVTDLLLTDAALEGLALGKQVLLMGLQETNLLFGPQRDEE
jgi:hypothetical protein